MSSTGSSQHNSLTRLSHQNTYNFSSNQGISMDDRGQNGPNPFGLVKQQNNSISQQLHKMGQNGEQHTRVTSASHHKGVNANEGKVNMAQNTIGVRSSFTQKPPTDSRQQPALYQKNLKYLDSNRLGSNNSQEGDKFSSTGSSHSAKRDQQIYRSMNGINLGNTVGQTQGHQSSSQVRQQQTSTVNRLLENSSTRQQTRPNNSETALTLNLTGKSRNQSGYNAVTGMNTGGYPGERTLNTGQDQMSIGEKFAINNIPRSTTNKTYTSLTNQLKEPEQLGPSTSRGLSTNGHQNTQSQQQPSQPSYMRTASSSQNYRQYQQASSQVQQQMNPLRQSQEQKPQSHTPPYYQSQKNSNVNTNANTTPKASNIDKKGISETFLSRHQRVEDQVKSKATKTMGSLSQQRYHESQAPSQIDTSARQKEQSQLSHYGTNQDNKSQTRSAARENQMARDIPNMKLARPNTVAYKEINTSTKSATQATIKSQTMGPSTLQQLIKEASSKNHDQQPQATVQPQRPSQNTVMQQRHKSNSREGLSSAAPSLIQQNQDQLTGGIGSSRNQQNQAHKSQQQIMTKQNLKQFFEANAGNMNMQQKIDPSTGVQTKVQSFTTLNINQMIHDADEDDEAKKLPLQPGTRIVIPNHEPTKCSMKRNGIVRAYAANTNQGLVRNYNEDRVSIILNIMKPEHRQHEEWPKCSFFGVYDGHGGHACAEFLRDNLHHFVIKEDSFPWNPKEAILKGFQKAEDRFMEMCMGTDENGNPTLVERSGSCAIVAMIVADMCYIANVGDSRAVLSANLGKTVQALSEDHKPSEPKEYQRIIAAGGQVYQTTTATSTTQSNGQEEEGDPDYIVGPIRVLPGRLSVSRTFGDPEAKVEFKGGNPNVVACIPDVKVFKITKDHDFIVLACDGIFDKMSNEDVSACVWNSCNIDNKGRKIAHNVHQQAGLAVESVLKNSLYRQSLDNVTVVMIAFQNFKRHVFGKSKNSERSAQKPTVKDQSSKHSALSSIHEFMSNTMESQKENINNNKAIKPNIGSFLSQRQGPQVTNDENMPPHSNYPGSSKFGSKNTSMKPPTSATLHNNNQGNKNMSHLLNTMNGNQSRSDSQPHSHSEALKEKTGMFINRTYTNQQSSGQQDQRQIGSRKPSLNGQVTNSLNLDHQNPLTFLNQQSTPKGPPSGQTSTIYRSLNGSLRNTMGSANSNGSLNMRGNPASGETVTLYYQVVKNREVFQVETIVVNGQVININETDLVSGLYEGGLKIWDCSIDLVNFLGQNSQFADGKTVLELGCGQGLPGIMALRYCSANYVAFQDYNQEVVNTVTKKALELNEANQSKAQFVHGSWEAIAQQRPDFQKKFDIILMSETLYNVQYYDQLMACIDHCLSNDQDAQVIIGTKTLYFGLGGGYFEFQKYIDSKWHDKFKIEMVQKFNNMKSIERLILRMTRHIKNIEEIKEGIDELQAEAILDEEESNHQEVDIMKIKQVCETVVSHLPKIRETINSTLDELESKQEFNHQDFKILARVANLYQKTNTESPQEDDLKKALKTSIKSFFPILKPSPVPSVSQPKSTQSQGSIESVLIKTPEQLDLLKEWLGYECSLKLLYRASKNGFAGPKFHFMCDNKGPSVTVFKSERGYIFGGYTSLKQHNPPNLNPTFEKDPHAFIFQLHPHKTKHELIPGVEKSIGRGRQRICIFGRTQLYEDNSDLEVVDECNTHNLSWSNLGHCYQLPEGVEYGSQKAKEWLAGAERFKVTEFEVFQVKKTVKH